MPPTTNRKTGWLPTPSLLLAGAGARAADEPAPPAPAPETTAIEVRGPGA